MNLIARVLTGGLNRGGPATGLADEAYGFEEYCRTRFAAAFTEAAARAMGATTPARNAIAACAVTLWAWEADHAGPASEAAGESNYNVGALRCPTATSFAGACARLGPERVRAFGTLRLGVAAWFATLQEDYPEAWTLLVVGDLRYWGVLIAAGYGGHATARQALALHDRVCAAVGVATMDDAERAEVIRGWESSDDEAPAPSPSTDPDDLVVSDSEGGRTYPAADESDGGGGGMVVAAGVAWGLGKLLRWW